MNAVTHRESYTPEERRAIRKWLIEQSRMVSLAKTEEGLAVAQEVFEEKSGGSEHRERFVEFATIFTTAIGAYLHKCLKDLA